MPPQNRVDPAGALHAVPAKGTLMGNRGRLHDSDRRILRQHTSAKGWIACTLEPVFGKRPGLMQPNSYTELFFLDEFTALAAGHRPCAQCRRKDYLEFVGAWRRAGLPSPATSPISKAIDAALDSERRAAKRPIVTFSELPNGAMVAQNDGEYFLVYWGGLMRWSFRGYEAPVPPESLSESFTLLTPPSTLQTLRAGYEVSVPQAENLFPG